MSGIDNYVKNLVLNAANQFTPAQERAIRYYKDILYDSQGEFSKMYVDEYGSGIPHYIWDTMKESGWFKYESGSYIIGSMETWTITEAGRKVFAPVRHE